jgi:transcription elongation factor
MYIYIYIYLYIYIYICIYISYRVEINENEKKNIILQENNINKFSILIKDIEKLNLVTTSTSKQVCTYMYEYV